LIEDESRCRNGVGERLRRNGAKQAVMASPVARSGTVIIPPKKCDYTIKNHKTPAPLSIELQGRWLLRACEI